MSRKLVISFVAILALVGITAVSQADHAWSNYHWARTTTSFDLIIINSTTTDWDPYVSQAIADWSDSQVLNMVEDPNGATTNQVRRRCNGGDGTVRICNLAYGNTGWLGIAGISIDNQGHIVTGYTKMNDTYFNDPFYDTFDWKQSVTCQELGHNVGLGHQDEDFNNQSLFSCMDYQNPPYPYPNAHDYEQLEIIYGHTDSYDSYVSSSGGGGGGGGNCNGNNPNCNNANPGWGISMGRHGNSEVFLKVDGNGTRHITHVRWVDEDHDH